MACPSCGGSERSAVAPGFFECTSLLTVSSVDMVPDGRGGAVPVEQRRTRVCGHRYHEGSGSVGHGPSCACGTFAIGTCHECGRAVCGDHSSLIDGHRLCSDDLVRAQAERAEAVRREQITIPQFLQRAAVAGNPGLRRWTLVKVEVLPLPNGAVSSGSAACTNRRCVRSGNWLAGCSRTAMGRGP